MLKAEVGNKKKLQEKVTALESENKKKTKK
jgi:hypothetical protein